MAKMVRNPLEAMREPLVLLHLWDGCNTLYIDVRDLDAWIDRNKQTMIYKDPRRFSLGGDDF